MLRLLRNLHFEVTQSTAVATKSALLGSQSAAPVTKSARRGSQSAAPVTKSALRGSQSAVPATKSALRGSPQVLCLPRNLQTSHMWKSYDSLHLSRNQSASTITTMSKLLHLPRNLHFEVKPLQSLAPVTKSRLWTSKARDFPCACQEK